MTINKDPIQVIRIISKDSVLINAGYKQGVKENQEFQIFLKGIEINDPTYDDKSLGTLDYIKANIIADTVLENMTVCLSNDYKNNPSPLVGAMMQFAKTSNRISLNVKPEDIEGYGINTDRPIKVKDYVRVKPVVLTDENPID